MPPPILKIITDISEIPALDWDALTENVPFLSHAYLYALQVSGSAAESIGWHPQILTLWQQHQLVGAMPLYLKMNSFGEFVFDFAWADAYHRHGLNYYPKLVFTIPFTPVTGPRLLTKDSQLRPLLLQHALQLAKDLGVSSLHGLFLNSADSQAAQAQGMLLRQDIQFHWQNNDYHHFDDFLAALSRDKRKRINQERRKVHDAGIKLQCITGYDATPEHWAFFASCYAHTRNQHHSPPALSNDFFMRIGATMPQSTLLIIATRDGKNIASALNFLNGDILYGRSWGAFEFHSGLHFEACYYQAIEFCITHQIKKFEGGAQGEHKLARGFLPTITQSAHWLARPEFSNAVEVFLSQESDAVSNYAEQLNERSPFKN